MSIFIPFALDFILELTVGNLSRVTPNEITKESQDVDEEEKE